GTRFTEARLLAAQEYAVSQGLPVPRNVLVPPIYDLTVAIPKTSPSPTLLRFCNGQSSVVYIHIKRRLMKQLPETDEAVAQRCKDIFVEKMITTTTPLRLNSLFWIFTEMLLKVLQQYGKMPQERAEVMLPPLAA
ncbi:hypothetical protein Golax_018235, partial [Gossypium laxum]|nr:hypothetical protein [Gossypium laxum]